MSATKRASNNTHLHELIEQHGLTPQSLADAWGIHRTSVHAWLAGTILPPFWTLTAARSLRQPEADLRVLTAVIPGEMRCTVTSVLKALGASGITFTNFS